MEKKTISAGIIGAGGFIGQEHLKRLTKQIDGTVCCIADAMITSQTSEAEIWYDRRRAWFVHRQIPPLGRYAGRFRRAGQRLSAGADYLLDASTRLSRVAAGHNEGFIEAFSNIYRSFCNVLSDRKAGRENTTDTFPTVENGVLGVRFVETCVRSHTWTYKAAPSLFDGSPPVLKVQRDFLM